MDVGSVWSVKAFFFLALVYNCVGAVHVREAREREHVELPPILVSFWAEKW